MPKGYWIAHIDVADPEQYKKYVVANARPFAKFGARFLVRAGTFEAAEGTSRSRNVVIEFPSAEAARRWYDSVEYRKVLPIRLQHAVYVEYVDGEHEYYDIAKDPFELRNMYTKLSRARRR